ncbi:MAG: metallophosphoesterase [Deltaproteobacteria bacterium]|nr:metallophosphoesterase [Deltaproteobacteria bacterium]
MRNIFGGYGSVEAPQWLMYSSSFVQNSFVFLFLLVFLKDVASLISLCFGPKRTAGFRKMLVGKWCVIVLLVLSCALSLTGLYNAAKVPEVRKSEIVIDDWPKGLDGLTVAILADMHISTFFDRRWVQQVVDRTMALKPELIVLPGDMVDGTPPMRADDVAPLAQLDAPYGVFACVGNHEYISQLQQWLPVFEELGIKMLYNSHEVIAPRGIPFILAGLTDITALSSRYDLMGPNLNMALEGAPEGLKVVLLEHRPIRAKQNALDERIILQLSGHTHGGMMPLLSLFVKMANDGYVRDWYTVGSLKLFVQPGLGLWNGFPVRLMDPSEITLLTIRSGDAARSGASVG